MADNNRKISIENDATETDEDAVIPVFETEDEIESAREPINLDDATSLEEAVAAARIDEESAPPAEEAAPHMEPEPAIDPRIVVDLKAQLQQSTDNYLRALADLQNYKRRTEEDLARRVREGHERTIKELLPVIDDFTLAVISAKNSQSYEQLIGGVEAILRKFNDILAKQGVQPIEAVGKPFDPDIHEAVMLDEESDLPDETVTAELRKGYLLNNRVIRPTLVKVAKTS